MATDKIQQMREWVEQLNQAADAYYNGQGELLTDYEWDARFDQLKRLEEETGVVLPDSPTNKVSADNISGAKEAHEFPALSLAKTKQPIDLAKWAEGRPIWMSWKLDGLTLVVTFDAGRLTKVVTRGNGHIGTNITHLANAIQGIPQTIPYQGHAVVRGECVISYADFEQFNMESDEEYANPRNLASGSLTLKDVDEVRLRHLRWIPFTLVHTDNEIRSWGARIEWLRQNGMHPVAHEEILNPTLQNIEQTIAHWTEQVTQKINPYPVDGLVITYDDTQYAQTGSVTGHHATRAGYAFKWQDEHADTTLDHVEWSCAASTISPVAIFSPVELEGTTVKRASLCNISECERLGIGEQGTKLRVIKANKIIPKVIEVIETVGTLQVPCACPVCQSPTQIQSFNRLRQDRLDFVQLAVNKDANGLKGSRCRVLSSLTSTDALRRDFRQLAGCINGRFASLRDNCTRNRATKPLFTIILDYLVYFIFAGNRQPIGSRLPARGIHAHIQGRIKAKAKPARRIVNLRRRNAQIKQRAINFCHAQFI